MARIASLRGIPAGATAHPRAPGRTQASPAGARIRLEGERARLQQEVAAWQRNLSRAEQRLRMVEEQLAALNGETPEPEAGPGWAGFTLEY